MLLTARAPKRRRRRPGLQVGSTWRLRAGRLARLAIRRKGRLVFDRVRPRFNHATVVAYLALFVALGGVSYGVATGSIDSREIKDNSVRSKDLRDNGVRAKDIRTGTVRSSDVGTIR